MSWRDEDILAFVDGEMPAESQARFEADLEADPDLAARTQAQRRLANRIRSHYAPVANDPVPRRFAALLGEEAPAYGVADRIRNWFTGPLAAPGLAALASLALGLFVGAQFLATDSGISGQSTLANAQLAAALDAPVGSEAWQIPVTFRDESGRYCRAFAGTSAATRGLACRAEQGWQVQLLISGEERPAAGYQLAASPLPSTLLDEIDRRIDGDPLDAESVERAAAADWRE
ncbi:anti-sigma factor family protein [Hyphobacterium sp.]|uniref:anti-sigma factor family protein n=1 Tax=Hyphobacterium sp. TaxID=2004662 RepID=UPI003B528E30